MFNLFGRRNKKKTWVDVTTFLAEYSKFEMTLRVAKIPKSDLWWVRLACEGHQGFSGAWVETDKVVEEALTRALDRATHDLNWTNPIKK